MMSKTMNYFCDNIDSCLKSNEALKKFNLNEYDIVLTDIVMPEMDGIELIQEVRKVNNEIPVFILTGYDVDNVKNKCESLNINGFFVKPMQVYDILHEIKYILERLD